MSYTDVITHFMINGTVYSEEDVIFQNKQHKKVTLKHINKTLDGTNGSLYNFTAHHYYDGNGISRHSEVEDVVLTMSPSYVNGYFVPVWHGTIEEL